MTKIDVRFGELLEPEDFIWINSAVRDVVGPIRHLPEGQAVAYLLDYACQNVRYPDTHQGLSPDRHELYAFPSRDIPFFGVQYRYHKVTDECFQLPSETLAWGYGDCDDTSILVCSLLRAYGISPERAFVVVGEFDGYGHAWVELDGQIIETTLCSPPAPAHVSAQALVSQLINWQKPAQYSGSWKFNDIGVLGEVALVPRVNERAKLALIAKIWNHPTKGLFPGK